MARAKLPRAVHQLTSAQFDATFPVGDEDACKAYLKARRWPEGVRCPRCGNPAVYDLHSRKWHWQCEKCAPDGYRFSIIAGTIFENTNKPLRDWFKVAHLILTSKKGMSSRQIGRYMGFGSVKTAWLMGHKIRTALIEKDMDKLGGIVEVDESFIGGKDKTSIGMASIADASIAPPPRRQLLMPLAVRVMLSPACLIESLQMRAKPSCAKWSPTELACLRLMKAKFIRD